MPCRLASQPVNEGRKVGETSKGNGDDAGCERRGRADYWKDLEPVLVEKENGGGSVCMLKCMKEGGGMWEATEHSEPSKDSTGPL